MSNSRIFCVGAFIAYLVCSVLHMLGFGDHSSLVHLLLSTLLALNFGISAVALFGDRQSGKSS